MIKLFEKQSTNPYLLSSQYLKSRVSLLNSAIIQKHSVKEIFSLVETSFEFLKKKTQLETSIRLKEAFMNVVLFNKKKCE